MTLTIKLFATFQKGRFDVGRLDCPPGTTLSTLVETLGIAGELIDGGRGRCGEGL
jgi:hypothetical protein